MALLKVIDGWMRPPRSRFTSSSNAVCAARSRTSCWAPDDALPPERDLAEEFSVSRITVRKAIDGLVAEGLLTRKQGSGTFVAGRVEKNFSKLTSFTEDMIARGRVPTKVSGCARARAP